MRPAGRFILERNGLAAADLQGLTRADRFQAVMRRTCKVFSAPLRRELGPLAEQDDQLLFGETFIVLEVKDGYALGQIGRDGYVGYVPAETLAEPADPATHRVAGLRAYAFAEPDFKAAATGAAPFNALITTTERHRGYLAAEGLGWISERQLTPVGAFEADPAAIAERFLGTPYLWGARDGVGIDCSALVMQTLNACGLGCPRDTDLQAAIGEAVDPAVLRRGDLVCWPGHVGLMLDEARLIHANTFHMAVAIELLAEAEARIADRTASPPIAWRRIS